MENNMQSVLFIRNKLKEDYFFEGIEKLGYKIVVPYAGNTFIPRCFRELWFRLHLPNEEMWFNKKLRDVRQDTIVVFDPIITPKFIEWISQKYSAKRLIFIYENRADRTLSPQYVPPIFEKYSYDKDDCREWNMHFFGGGYMEMFKTDQNPFQDFDILYVGRDKGRAKKLFSLKKQFTELGLSMYLHICPDRRYIHKIRLFYKPILKYEDYLLLVKRTKSILNIMPEGQTSITWRDFECVFDSIKGITNNKGILQWKYYDPSRFFVLGVDEIESLPTFLNTPFKRVDEKDLLEISFSTALNNLILGGK